jgi:uncharacterized membrane protein
MSSEWFVFALVAVLGGFLACALLGTCVYVGTLAALRKHDAEVHQPRARGDRQ